LVLIRFQFKSVLLLTQLLNRLTLSRPDQIRQDFFLKRKIKKTIDSEPNYPSILSVVCECNNSCFLKYFLIKNILK
jgi:hypothetical protein